MKQKTKTVVTPQRMAQEQRVRKAVEMYKAGFTNKEIAQKIGITEKTASKWLKPVRYQLNEMMCMKISLTKRINKMLQDEKADSNKITGLIRALKMLEND